MATEAKQNHAAGKGSVSSSDKSTTTTSSGSKSGESKEKLHNDDLYADGNDDDPNRRNNNNNSNKKTCGSDSESESDVDLDSSTTNQEEIKEAEDARQKNEDRPTEQRQHESLVDLFNRLTNPDRTNRAGGEYGTVRGFSCLNKGTNENNHIPASSVVEGSNFVKLNRNNQLAITMFKVHHRSWISTGSSAASKEFRNTQKNLLNEKGFASALEYELQTFNENGLSLLYTFGWYDLLLKALRKNLISDDEAIYLLEKLLSHIDLTDGGRNLRILLETYVNIFGTDAGFYEFLKKFKNDIRTVLSARILKIQKK